MSTEIDLDEETLKEDIAFYELKNAVDMKLNSKREEITKEICIIENSNNDDDLSVETMVSTLTVISFKLPFMAGSRESM